MTVYTNKNNIYHKSCLILLSFQKRNTKKAVMHVNSYRACIQSVVFLAPLHIINCSCIVAHIFLRQISGEAGLLHNNCGIWKICLAT